MGTVNFAFLQNHSDIFNEVRTGSVAEKKGLSVFDGFGGGPHDSLLEGLEDVLGVGHVKN